MPPKSQNILIVMADQMSAPACGYSGNPFARTPNIDALAARGVVFDAAYSSSPLCAPARYAMMTGRHASLCGGYDNAAYLPATTPTFAHAMRRAGYRTVLCGKMHFIGPDQLHGFEERLTTDVYPADFGWVPDWTRPDERIDLWYHNMSSVKQAGVAAITNQLSYDDEAGARALAAIYDHARGGDDRPLCMVVGFIHPHDPYAARQQFWDVYDGVDIPPPTVPRLPADKQDAHSRRLERVIDLDAVALTDAEIATARRAYFANVSYIDHWLGRLQNALDECGMRDTTVLFTSDHGDMLGERGLWFKMSFMEWACRVPLILAGPGVSPRRSASAVALVDVMPTLMDLAEEAGADVGEAIDPLSGESLLPLCARDDDTRMAVSEYMAEGTAAPMLMLRRGRYKYIACETDPELLFDLEADANELHNLATAESHAGVMRGFRAAAAAHWDVDAVRDEVLDSQRRRREVYAALAVGRHHSWDYNPPRDAAEEFTRSHHELTAFDAESRWPRPVEF